MLYASHKENLIQFLTKVNVHFHTEYVIYVSSKYLRFNNALNFWFTLKDNFLTGIVDDDIRTQNIQNSINLRNFMLGRFLYNI